MKLAAVLFGNTTRRPLCLKNVYLESCFFTLQYVNLCAMPRRTKKQIEEDALAAENTAEPIEERTAKIRPRLPFDQFVQRMTGLKPDDCPSLYVYRTKPKIDIKLSGREHQNLEKLSEMPADLRGYVKMNHGGGEYQLLLNADNWSPTAVAECILEIPISEADPILDPVELVRGKVDTEQLIRRWQKEGKITIGPAGEVLKVGPGAATPGGVAPAPTGNPLVDLVMSKAISKAFEAPPAPTLTELLAVMKAGDGGQAQMMQFFIQQLQASQTQNNTLLAQVIELKTAPKTGGGLDSTLAAIEKLKGIMPSSGSESSWVRDLIAAAPAIMGPLVGAFMAFKGVGMPGGGGVPQTTAAPGAGGQVTEEQAQQHAYMMQLHQFASSVIRAVKTNREPSDFAESFIDMAGEDRYQQVIAMGAPAILATFHAFPDLAPQLNERKADIDIFMTGFIHAYDEPAEPGTDEEIVQ